MTILQQPVRKTYPTTSAGPHTPLPPLISSLLRIVPGNPRRSVPPVTWLSSNPPSSPLTLEARLDDVVACIHLPTNEESPIPDEWLDFSLPDVLSYTTHITFNISTTTDSLSTQFLLTDFADLKGVLRRPLIDPRGHPVALLTLDYLVINAYPNPTSFPQTKHPFVPTFTGHRGMGSSGPKAPWRLLENSIESFLTAASRDTPCKTVELDVQITRDHRTVIYHDWFFRPRTHDGSPIYDPEAVQLPIHNMTFAQFDNLYRQSYGHWARDQCGDPTTRAELRNFVTKRNIPSSVFEVRALSLRDVCEMIPEDVGLLVEIKYPSPNDDGEVPIPFLEKNHCIDLVLDDLYAVDCNRRRKIAFLSFDADVGTMLSLKQTRFPVYLSHCSALDKPCDMYDPRLIDLSEGHRFVKAIGLDGLMILNLLVEMFPEAVQEALKDKVNILTYGKRNCDVNFVRRQLNLGIRGIIADDVIKLVQELEM